MNNEEAQRGAAHAVAVLDRSELKHAAQQEEPEQPVFTLDEQLAAVEAERARLLAQKQGGA